MNPVFKIFSSLLLTVILLAFSLVLVFFGTLDQARWGIHQTQKLYFESLFVMTPVISLFDLLASGTFNTKIEWFKVPLPGGFLLGGLLVINLLCVHFRYFKASWKKIGIMLIHGGVVLLLISGFLIAFFQEESQMFIDEVGKPVNYSTDFRQAELVFIDQSDPSVERITSIPGSMLVDGKTIDLTELPFNVYVDGFVPNGGTAIGTRLEQHYEQMIAAPNAPEEQKVELRAAIEAVQQGDALVLSENGQAVLRRGDKKLQGFASRMGGVIQQQPEVYSMEETNMPAAVITLVNNDGTDFGTWMVSSGFGDNIPPQIVTVDGQDYEVALRFKRYYNPFWIQLQDFSHDKYPGTEVAMNFSSDIILKNPDTGEDRRVLIYMNHPLRYAGLTFFQQSFLKDEKTSILMVVRNPAWTLPYIAVALVGVGMVIHFTMSLFRFARKQNKGSLA